MLGNISHLLILDSWHYVYKCWHDSCGGRSSAICIPKVKCLHDLPMVQIVEKNIDLRSIVEALNDHNHVPRDQAQRKCAQTQFVVHMKHVEYVLRFDLHRGFTELGSIFTISKEVDVPQGSFLSPSIAEIVLVSTEHKNKKMFITESPRWMFCFSRFVDDVLCGLVVFLSRTSSSSQRATCMGALRVWFEENICEAQEMYKKNNFWSER